MTNTPHTADRCTARRGFTLTELMVVTTLIGVMAAMSIPSFQRAVEQSRADIAAANLRAIWAAERLFWLENHAYTDKLSQQSPQPVGLMQLGLLDPSLPLTESAGTQSGGGYYYTVVAGSDTTPTFTATATRCGTSSCFTIDQSGTMGGTVTVGGCAITPGFQ